MAERTTVAPKLKLLTQEVPERVYPEMQLRQEVAALMHVTQGEVQTVQITGWKMSPFCELVCWRRGEVEVPITSVAGRSATYPGRHMKQLLALQFPHPAGQVWQTLLVVR